MQQLTVGVMTALLMMLAAWWHAAHGTGRYDDNLYELVRRTA